MIACFPSERSRRNRLEKDKGGGLDLVNMGYGRLVGVIELQINGGIMSISVLRCYRLGLRVVRHEQAGLIRLCVCIGCT